MKKLTLDSTDRRILNLLQAKSDMTLKEIAKAVNLSTTPCWKRIQQLQDSGIIRASVALLDAHKVNLDLTVFVAVRTSEHNIEWSDKFTQIVQTFPEITEVYRMSGEIDYMLKVVVEDTRAYDAFYKRLIKQISLSDINSMFAMEEMKYTTALPISVLPNEEQ
ncbi:MAG: Lrp/AsnC family transcriptional regulator [Saprospiraceae bacterium]|jgi:Lrp/AsnC family transcriptional regulator